MRAEPWGAFFLFVKWARIGAQTPGGTSRERLPRARRVRGRRARAIGETAARRRQSAARPSDRRATARPRRRAAGGTRCATTTIRRRRRVTEPGEVRGVVLGGTGGVWQVRTEAGETVDASTARSIKEVE